MALDPVVNFFRSTIATLPVASGGTSIVLQTGDGAKLPDPAVDGAFNLTIYNADDQFASPEIVRVTAISGDTLTVTRAQEGTSATNKTSGATWNVELTPTAKTIQDIDSAKLDVAGGTMTGDLTIPDKIIHSGDTNTAIRFPANDTVSVETAGSERVRVTSAGSVGIGTTSPGDIFHVAGAFGTSMILERINTPSKWAIGVGENVSGDFRIKDIISDETRLEILSNGNVGIGTTSPATKLDVVGAIQSSSNIIGNQFRSVDTTVSVPTGTATTVLSLDAGVTIDDRFAGWIFVRDNLGTRAGAMGQFVRFTDGTNASTILFNVQNSGVNGAALTLSGNDIKFTHTVGSTRTIRVTVIYMLNEGR